MKPDGVVSEKNKIQKQLSCSSYYWYGGTNLEMLYAVRPDIWEETDKDQELWRLAEVPEQDRLSQHVQGV